MYGVQELTGGMESTYMAGWLHWLGWWGCDVLRTNKRGVGLGRGTYDWGIAKVLCQELRIGS
jgi:hypothetical protein